MKKFMAVPKNFSWDIRIVPVEVERETDACIWINGRRSLKSSSYESYYNSWEDARLAIQTQAEGEIARLQDRLRQYEDALREIKNMRDPEDAA